MSESESPTVKRIRSPREQVGYRGAVPIGAHRIHFGLRLRPQMRQAIEDRANANGRSMSQEAETMFERELLLDQVFGEAANPSFSVAVAFATGGPRGVIEHLLKTCSAMELRQYIHSAEARAEESQS